MLGILLTEEIRKYFRFNDIQADPPDPNPDKLLHTTNRLEKMALEHKHCVRHMVMSYAYYYVQELGATNFLKIYLLLTRFEDAFTAWGKQLDSPWSQHATEIITDEDVFDALDLEGVWLGLNKFSLSTLPFLARKAVSTKYVLLGKNTRFQYSRDYMKFISIAFWINRNRRFYPQVHGYEEFFLHLPAVTGPRDFLPRDFLRVDRTIEQYYKAVYGDEPRNKRFDIFFNTLHHSLRNAQHFRKSNLFAAPDIIKRLQEPSVQHV